MRTISKLAYAGASLLALATAPAFAQGAKQGPDSVSSEDAGDIVVSARRREENVQDVPLVVNAVTSESLSKLNIRDFRDVQSVVPGLTLTPAPNGTGTSATIRGVNNDVNAAGTNGTIQFYMNDAPIPLSTLFTAMFDVGQIEVLRGPQGTLRGRAAPSGSFTLTTRRPDLDQVGGYINMTGQTHGAINVNGAIGLPIIRDVLAVRVAGLYDANDSTRIISYNNGKSPFSETHGERVSVRFDPFNALSINASFSNVVRDAADYQQLESANIADPTQAASPRLITAQDRAGLTVLAQPANAHYKIWNLQADWRVAGQRLVYVGSHTTSRNTSLAPNDNANLYAGLPDAVRFSGQAIDSRNSEWSHELRLQSDERLAGMFDYVLGGFIYKTRPHTLITQQTSIFRGSPPTAANFLQARNTVINRNSDSIERSAFFNLTAHFGEATELSAGGRYIHYEANNFTIIPAANTNRNDPYNDNQWIYSASLKHRFNDDLMVYASVGSSWRPGATTNGIIDTNGAPSAVERALQLPQPAETSTSYEIGFKSEFLDKRLRLNVSAFHQDFKNYILFVPSIFVAYTDPVSRVQSARSLSGLATGVPAKVDGVEGELSYLITPHWNLNVSAAYAKSKIKNGGVPCNLYTGTPTYASIVAASGGQTVGICQVNYSVSRSSPFSATVQSEYTAPVSGNVDAFLRGLATFNGNNQNDPANRFDDIKNYALVNLYTGIRSPDGTWEVSLFAKNVFNSERVISRNANLVNAAVQLGATGSNLFAPYRSITMTQPREFGLNVRYAFGSR